MARDFDIYLKRHLTECDLIVYSIPFYDGITVTDRLVLEAALSGYILQKFAAVQMKSEVTAHIDDMIKLCLEKLDMATVLGASAEFEVHDFIHLNDNRIVIDTPNVDTFARVMSEMENKLVLAVKPLETQIFKSIGKVGSIIDIETRLINTFKHGFVQAKTGIDVGADIEQINQIDYIDANAQTIIGSTLESLCYQLTFSASTAVKLSALVLGTEIRHSLGVWYNSLILDSDVKQTSAQKFITAEAIVEIMLEAAGTLVKVMYLDNEGIVADALILGTSIKRYRLLDDIDPESLADIDDLKLDELDYEELA